MIKIGAREFESMEAARDFFRHWFKKSRLHRFDIAELFRKEMEQEGKKCSSVMVNGRVYEFTDKERAEYAKLKEEVDSWEQRMQASVGT